MAYLDGLGRVSLPGSARVALTPFKPQLARAPTQMMKTQLSTSRFMSAADARAKSDRDAAFLAAQPKSQAQLERENRLRIYKAALAAGRSYQDAQAIVTAQTGKPYSAF